MTRRPATSISGTPILIGAVTVLIGVIAVFLAYNANSGLPFIPSYRVTAEVYDAAGLVDGNEVRVGGKRVGTVQSIAGRIGQHGTYAELQLKLDKAIQPIRDDSQVRVRPRSPLGLKYLELMPGRFGRAIGDGGRLDLRQARRSVELDEVLNAFDKNTRTSLQEMLDQLGPGLAGRGLDFNAALASAPPFVTHLEHVAANLADPRTGLRRALRSVADVVTAIAPVAPQLGSLIGGADRTAAALASVSPELAQVIEELPDTELTGTEALAVARPVLRDTRLLLQDIKPGIAVLPLAAGRLHSALLLGIPVLRRAGALSDRLRTALRAVERLASDPLARSALARLRRALDSLIPTLRFVAPAQTKCNYLGVYLRNLASSVSEGDSAGTWFRTLVIAQTNQFMPRATPSPDLHANPYPFTAAPGQHGLCEAGNEPYKPGQVFGHPAGVHAHYTEDTSPPPGVPGG